MDETKKSEALILLDKIEKANPQLVDAKKETQPISSDERYSTSKEKAFQSSRQFLKEFPHHRFVTIWRALENFSRKQRFYSLINMSQFRGHEGSLNIREVNGIFSPATGSIIITESLKTSDSPLSAFFRSDPDNPHLRRTYQTGDYTELRGRNYFIAKVQNRSAQEKYATIQKDLVDGITLLAQIKREEINNPKDYLLYLGLLDYMKMHTQTIFHALTYNERHGVTVDDPKDLKEYQLRNQQAIDLMQQYTRMYYQTLFGIDYDQPKADPIQMTEHIKKLINYARKEGERAVSKGLGKPYHRFKYPEVNHSLVIALGVQEAALKNPDAEVLVGIPTGGTETAIVTKLMYENLLGRSPELLFIPLSIHSEIKGKNGFISANDLMDQYYNRLSNLVYRYYKQSLFRRSVLLIDDNSASGQTLEIMVRVLRDNLAKVSVHLAEYDGRRFLLTTGAKVAPEDYFDPSTSPTTKGLTQVGLNNKHAYLEEINKRLE